ncbi:MAG: THUMP domain-containing protein [Lautropia sp.]|nr:THUMP domain-containing protein [Lautropia sp.]
MTSDSKPPQRSFPRLQPASDRQGHRGQPRQGQSPASRQGGRHASKPRHAPSSSIQPLNPKKLSEDDVLDFFCPCPRGLEQVLADELKALGATAVEITHGGVACQGKLQLAYRINLEARLPSRVMLRLIEAPCPHEHALYRLCHSIGWENWFSAQHTLRVDVVAIRSPLKSLNFATLRIKDAIVDHFRERGGIRPSIDTRNPDVRIHAFLNADRLQLYLDLSGEPLFKRGWRSSQDRHVSAPLKENLAAGLLALSGWQPGQPLGDLFCGSGTIIIEAAQQLCQRAPGLDRKFGIEQLSIHQPALFDELLSKLRERARQGIEAAPKNLLWASDLDADAIELARDNLALAGLPKDIVQFQVADAATMLPPVSLHTQEPQADGHTAIAHRHDSASVDVDVDAVKDAPDTSNIPTSAKATTPTANSQTGIIVSNPPYNERVEIPIEHWRDIGRNLRDHFGGWHVFLLTSDRGLPGQLGLRERHKTPLFNGAIECRLFDFEMRVRG